MALHTIVRSGPYRGWLLTLDEFNHTAADGSGRVLAQLATSYRADALRGTAYLREGQAEYDLALDAALRYDSAQVEKALTQVLAWVEQLLTCDDPDVPMTGRDHWRGLVDAGREARERHAADGEPERHAFEVVAAVSVRP